MPLWRPIKEGDVAVARAGLGDDAFVAAWAVGRATSLAQAMDLALSTVPTVLPAAASADRPPGDLADQQSSPLSPREAEAAALIAHGLTNRDIGNRLVITERTVDAHVRHILDKLGFASWAQIAAWAVRQGLVSD
jgi:DNA-binding NarL/FixJ family response regulator